MAECSKRQPTLSQIIAIHGKSIKYYSHIELTAFLRSPPLVPVFFFLSISAISSRQLVGQHNRCDALESTIVDVSSMRKNNKFNFDLH